MLKHRGVQVLLAVSLYLSIASFLPETVHQGLYTFSLLIKDLLVWMLPATVCFFIAHAISSFEKKAPLFVLALILFEGFSNLCSVWYAFGCGNLTGHFLPSIIALPAAETDFSPLWRFPFLKPSWWSADKGTLAGVVLGFISAKNPQFVERGKRIAERVLTRFFSRMIPLFVLGFVARMHQTNLLNHLFSQYAFLLFWLVLFLALYISFLFLMGGSFVRSIKNLLPAGSLAFTSGCSLSTMPWTIEGAAKNLEKPELAKAVIPATTNIQQIGDCIANAFLCFLIYRQFNGHNPDWTTWMTFTSLFVLARFATAAILGGAIFLMLPIYEKTLGFNPEMIAIILAFNVILDPLITSCNVMANGALCRLFEKFWNLLQFRRDVLD